MFAVQIIGIVTGFELASNVGMVLGISLLFFCGRDGVIRLIGILMLLPTPFMYF